MTEVIIDQSVHPRTWRYLDVPILRGAASVTLDNRTSDPATTRAVIADAIRLGSGSFDSFSNIPLRAPMTPCQAQRARQALVGDRCFLLTQCFLTQPDTSLVALSQ